MIVRHIFEISDDSRVRITTKTVVRRSSMTWRMTLHFAMFAFTPVSLIYPGVNSRAELVTLASGLRRCEIQDRKSFGTTPGLRYFTKIQTDIIKNQESTLTHFYVYGSVATPRTGRLAKKMRNSQTEAAYDSMGSTFRACSYYPACRDISPSATNISVHSYMAFHPACRNEFEINKNINK